jgi:hypothetical protein
VRRAEVSDRGRVRQVTALRADVERLIKDYETTRLERDKVCISGTPCHCPHPACLPLMLVILGASIDHGACHNHRASTAYCSI